MNCLFRAISGASNYLRFHIGYFCCSFELIRTTTINIGLPDRQRNDDPSSHSLGMAGKFRGNTDRSDGGSDACIERNVACAEVFLSAEPPADSCGILEASAGNCRRRTCNQELKRADRVHPKLVLYEPGAGVASTRRPAAECGSVCC